MHATTCFRVACTVVFHSVAAAPPPSNVSVSAPFGVRARQRQSADCRSAEEEEDWTIGKITLSLLHAFHVTHEVRLPSINVVYYIVNQNSFPCC